MNASLKHEPVQHTDQPHRPGMYKRTKLAVLLAAVGMITGLAMVTEWVDPLIGGETTEDAYVDGNIVQVTPQLAGTVVLIGADNTDFVRAGQTVVQLNELDAKLTLERAEAQYFKAVRQVRAQFANASQMRASREQRGADLAKAQADLARRKQLADSGAISGEDVHHAEDALKAARAAYAAANQQMAAASALVDGTTLANHPDIASALSQLRDAQVAVYRTTLAAPVSGIVTKRNVQIGQRVAPGAPLMSIVPLDNLWINANFKESQLRHLRIGQKATMTADAYGIKVVYRGHVVGQEAGTGSAFSLLPAQNATGNWIKVVQRVPIRIALDPLEVERHPLRLGLSMKVEVDTEDKSGSILSTTVNPRHALKTEVFAQESAAAERAVQQILRAGAATHTVISQHSPS